MESYIRNLIETTVSLSRSYSIWWELVNEENKNRREKFIKDHEDFFVSTAESHFQLLCICIYQMFDKRNGTVSIHNLLRKIEETTPAFVKELREELAPHSGIIKKIFHIRGNVYAHRNEALEPESVFKKAGLTPNALGSVIGVIEEVISRLADHFEVENQEELMAEFCRRADFARDDLKLLLGERI